MATDLNAAQTQVSEFRVDALAMCTTADDLIADVSALRVHLADAETVNQNQANTIASLESDLAAANQAKNDAEALAADLQAQVTVLEAQVKDLQEQIVNLTPPPPP